MLSFIEMKYRGLGKTGIIVSELGFGAWGIGGTANGAIGYGPTDDKESKAALRKAYELGITFFDTADLYGYGHSEELIGECFGKSRKSIVIASKVGFLNFDGEQDFSTKHIQKALEDSLKRLQTDYIDVYQLHSPSVDLLRKDRDIVATLECLRREGKVRAIGISAISPADGLAAANEFDFDIIEVNLNLVDQRAIENGLLNLCKKKGIGIIIRTPLCYGFLTGKYMADGIFAQGDQRRKWSRQQIDRWSNAYKMFVNNLAQKEQTTASQLALRFCLSCPGVSTVIPGMLTREHVEENVLSSRLGALSKSDLQSIFATYQKNVFFENN